MVTGLSKPWKEDYELEQEGHELKTLKKYGKKIEWAKIEPTTETDVLYLETKGEITTKIVVSDNKVIEYLAKQLSELDKQVKFLKEQQKQSQLNNLLEQNESSRKDLESIFDIDPNDQVDTKTLDGLLKDYGDPKENSAELVRSGRNSS